MILQTEIQEERSLSVGPGIEILYEIEATASRSFPRAGETTEEPLSFDVSSFSFSLFLDGEEQPPCSCHVFEKLVLRDIETRIESGALAFLPWYDPEQD